MKRILLRSVYDAFDYVMKHYYPFGMEEFAERKDSYAVISIQDTHTEGFGVVFTRNRFCQNVLTLYFDDIVKEIGGATLFSEKQAKQIIEFIKVNSNVDTLLVHCYGGESRSRAVAAFAIKMLGGDNTKYFKTGRPNEYVYNVLMKVWKEVNVQSKYLTTTAEKGTKL